MVDTGRLHSSLATCLYSDVAAKIASYMMLELEGFTVSFPLSKQHNLPDHDCWLEQANDIDIDDAGYKQLVSDEQKLKWARKHQRQLDRWGLYFGGSDGAERNRYFSLLKGEDGELKLLAYLFKPGLTKKITGEGNLRSMSTNNLWTKSTECALLLPLYRDKHSWLNYRFLAGVPKSCRLFKRDKNYFVAVSYAFNKPPVFETDGEITYEVINLPEKMIEIKASNWTTPDSMFWDDIAKIRSERRRHQNNLRDISGDKREYAAIKTWTHITTNKIVSESVDAKKKVVIVGGALRIKGFIDILNNKLAFAGAPKAQWLKKETTVFQVLSISENEIRIYNSEHQYAETLLLDSLYSDDSTIYSKADTMIDIAIKTDTRIVVNAPKQNPIVKRLVSALNKILVTKHMSKVRLLVVHSQSKGNGNS